MRKLKLFTLLTALCCTMMMWAETEGPWTYDGYKTGCCGQGSNASITYDGLNNSGWSQFTFWQNDKNGIGFTLGGASKASYKYGVFAIYHNTQTVESYSRKRLTWSFQLRVRSASGFSSTDCVYAMNNLSTLKATPFDFTGDYTNRAGSGYCKGSYTRSDPQNIGIGNRNNRTFDFDNRSGSSSASITMYLLHSHVTNTSSVVSSMTQWGGFKDAGATWTTYYYKVVNFYGNGSTSGSMSQQSIENSGNLTNNAFSRTGYSFAGWATSSNGNVAYANQANISVNQSTRGVLNLYAKWNLVTYNISCNLNGGSVSSANPTSYNVTTNTITLNNPTRTGYTFTGWTGSNGTTPQTTVTIAKGSTGDKNYTANWTANQYTVTFDMQEGAGGSEQVQATYASAMPEITLPTRTGYTFQGYYTQTGGNGTKYYNADGTSAANWNITSATTLYAKWTANQYTVILDMQGGTDGSEQVQATYNAAMPSITVPTLSEYEFKGYYSEANGGGTLYYNANGSSAATYTLTAGTTLYAKWQSLWGDDLTVVEDTDPTTYTPTQIVNGGFESNPNDNPYYSNNEEYVIGDGWMTSEEEPDDVGNYFEWLSSQIAQWSCGNSASGKHSVEMNAQNSAVLYQDLTTTELDVIRWSLKHGARNNYGPTKQSMRVEVGAPQMYNGGIELATGVNDYINAYIEESTMAIYTHNGISGYNGYDGENLANLILDKEVQCDQWYTVKGVYIIPEGQTITRFAFIADSEADQNDAPAKRTFEERKAAAMAKAAARKTKLDEEECYECWCDPAWCDNPDDLCEYHGECGEEEDEEESGWGILSGGNFLDDVDFATLIGNLSAVYNDDGTVTIRGYWGEEDTSKKLIVKIGSTMHRADMSSVLHKNFKISVSKADIGTNTYLEVYHQSYENAKRVLEIDHTTTLADNMDTTEWTVSPAYATTGSTVTLTYTGLENIGTITAINNADEEQSVTLTATSTPNQWTFTMPDYNVHLDCEILPPNNVASGECGAQGDNLLWTYYSNGVLEITGTGAMADYEVSTTDYPWVDYKTTIHTVSLPDGETTIGKDAFKGLSNLTTVTLPSALTTISENAFYGCPITSMTIPSTVVTIGASAFNSCSNLTAITMLTETPPALGTNAFSNCSSTLTITVPSCDAVIAYGSAANWSALANKIVSATGECPASVSDQQTATVINTTLQELIDNGSTEDDLTIVRPVYKNTYYNTLCFPFSMTAAQIAASPLAGATIKECTGAQVVGDELQIVFSDVTEIVAGEPYFVSYENADALTQMDFENVDVTTITAGQSETYNGVTFKGTFVPFAMPAQTADSYSYLFLGQNNTLFWPNVANNLLPFRCYFEINTGSKALVRRGMNARIVEEQQNATGVENVERGETSVQKVLRNGQLFIIKNGVEYNAQGQMVK